MKKPMTKKYARTLAKRFRKFQNFAAFLTPEMIENWPPRTLRSAEIWLEVHEETPLLIRQALSLTLRSFVDSRNHLIACRICGCTEDAACVNGNGEACYWIDSDLCSECHYDGCVQAKRSSKS